MGVRIEFVDYVEKLGVISDFIQELSSAEESFIPPFEHTYVLKEQSSYLTEVIARWRNSVC